MALVGSQDGVVEDRRPTHSLHSATPAPAVTGCTSSWSSQDRFFKPAHAERLAPDLTNARLARIDNARSLSPEDQPGRLAELIAGFD